MLLYHMILIVVLYFHLFNIQSYSVLCFTSSVSCMSNEIIDSVMKSNATYRE